MNESHDLNLIIEMFLRKKYTVTRSPRSDVLGKEFHYLTAEVSDLASEISKFISTMDSEAGNESF